VISDHYLIKGLSMTEKNSSTLTEGSFTTTTLSIGGMGCEACVSRIEQALKAVPGVQKVVVNLEAKKALVTYIPGQVIPEMLVQAISSAGYTFEGAD
jgi:copper chaperone CopZ